MSDLHSVPKPATGATSTSAWATAGVPSRPGHPQAANTERVGFAVLGVAIKAIDDAGVVASASGLNISLDAQFVADINSIASTVNGAVPDAAPK